MIDRETLLEAIRSAIESAARKSMNHAANVTVDIAALALRSGNAVEDMVIRMEDGSLAGGIKMANGTNPLRTSPFPGTRAKSAALMRAQLVAAQEYCAKQADRSLPADKRPARDLGKEALCEVLDGRRIVHHHTHRHDDILTDFRELAGRDILVVRKDTRFEPSDYEPYFERVEYRQVNVRGVDFHLIEGHGFRYEPYRDAILDEIRRRWYALPAWLPQGPCYFCDRYFPERSCHR